MAEINVKLETKVEISDEKFITVKKEIENSLSKDPNSKIDSRIKELEDRKQRSSNLIVYNLPESTSTNPAERKESDERLLKKLAHSLDIDVLDNIKWV